VSFLELTVSPKYRGRLCGLCGNFDGDRANDFYGRRGERHLDGQAFGDNWRVGGLRACSVLPRDMPHSYEPQCTQTWESKIKSDRNCNALNSTLFHACAAKVDTSYYYNACKLDMCECPGDNCHCEVLTAYARECEREEKLFFPDWREKTGCVNVSSFSFRHSDVASNEVVPPAGSVIQSKPVWQQKISASRLNNEQISAEAEEDAAASAAAATDADDGAKDVDADAAVKKLGRIQAGGLRLKKKRKKD
jgi:hypothetical protein